MTRLDKILSTQLNISRTDAKALLKKGRVSVNGTVTKTADTKCADSDIVTVDGEFAHSILSPSKHIDKTYVAHLDKPITAELVEDFRGGMELNGEKLLEAEVTPIDGDLTVCKVVLRQGLYHQVKRMFKKHGITVTALDRVKMGNLSLDSSLKPGESRYLTAEELDLICGK